MEKKKQIKTEVKYISFSTKQIKKSDSHFHFYLWVRIVIFKHKVIKGEVLDVGDWSGDPESREWSGDSAKLNLQGLFVVQINMTVSESVNKFPRLKHFIQHPITDSVHK